MTRSTLQGAGEVWPAEAVCLAASVDAGVIGSTKDQPGIAMNSIVSRRQWQVWDKKKK